MLVPCLVGLLLVAAFARHSLRTPHALIDLRLFRTRAVTASAMTTLLFGAAFFGAMLLLPLYFQLRDVQLLGTIWSLVIAYGGAQLPFAIFLITTFLRSGVPLEYEEAAQIDGAGPIRAFWHVVVPLLRPVLGTCAILVGVTVWNDFFTPLFFLSGSGQVTIPMAIYQYVGQYVNNWPLIFASLIISMLPILAVYLLLQRYVIQGFAGGLKG